MKIPDDLLQREQFYTDVLLACMKSVDRRSQTYNWLNYYYTYGCAPNETESPYNKIAPVVDTLTAFLYSADSTRFSGVLGPEVHPDEWDKVPAVSRYVNSEWVNIGADLEFQAALDMSMVYGTMICKWLVKNKHLQPHSIEPHCFGVYREDINGLDRQEAMAHIFYITRSQLEEELANHPQRDTILKKIQAKPKSTDTGYPERLRQIILNGMATQSYPGNGPLTPGGIVTGSGNPAWGVTEIDYTPVIDVDVVEMAELWVWNGDFQGGQGDYQTVTIANGEVTIYDRPNIFMHRRHPFGQVCPAPRKGYFWGDIMIAKLIALQNKRNVGMARIDDFRAKQANPPRTLEGFTGAIDEIDMALDKTGGTVPLGDNPMAKVNLLKRDVPADLYADIREIDEMFMEAAALPPLLMGRGEAGVRSGRQTSELSRLGSSRIKKRALIVEDNLNYFVTKGFQAMRKYQDEVLTTEPTKPGAQPMKFGLHQTDPSLMIKVDAHSNSPLFVEDQKAMAAELLESRSITRSRFVEMLNPPMKDVILRELKGIEAVEAKQQQQQQAQEAMQQQTKAAAKQGASQPTGATAQAGQPGLPGMQRVK